MRKYLTFLGSVALVVGGALTSFAAPPADTNPTPTPSTPKAADKAPPKKDDAQKSPDARKDDVKAAPRNDRDNATGDRSQSNRPTSDDRNNRDDRNASNDRNPSAQDNRNAPRPDDRNAPDNRNAPAANDRNQPAPNIQPGQNNRTFSSAPNANAPNPANANVQGGANVQGRANVQAGPNVRAGANVNVPNQAGVNVQGAPAVRSYGTQFANALGVNWAQTPNGLTIGNVAPNSVFANAGFLPNDQIVSVAGQTYANPNAFYQYLSTVPVGQQVPITVMRNGVQQTIAWTPTQTFMQSLPPQQNVVAVQLSPAPFDQLGMVLDQRILDAAVVAQVAPGSPAQQAGITAGDTIVAVNDRHVVGPTDLRNAVNELPQGAPLNFSLARAPAVTASRVVPAAVQPVQPVAPVPPPGGPVRRFIRGR